MSPKTNDRPFPIQDFFGFALTSSEPGHCVASTVITDVHLNPNGVVHGGVLFTMADTAMGRATMDLLPPGDICASIEVHVRFLRPVSSGALRVEIRAIKHGSRIVHLEGHAFDDEQRVVAAVAGSFAVIPARE